MMYRPLLILCCLSFAVSGADVYRSVDEHGNVVFSDTPSPGAEKVELPETQTISPPRVESFEYEPQKQKVEPYKVEVTAPANDTAIRDNTGEGVVSVSVSVTPGLQPLDSLVLYLDGKEYASGKSQSFTLSKLDRGTHQLRAVVKDKGGRILKSSPTVSFHILRHSILHPKPKAP